MEGFAAARMRMVETQIAARGIRNPEVLAAMRGVPREEFVPPHLAAFAYDDSPLPIEAAQTISQPYVVALMIEAGGVAPGGRVLEVGAGSGYAAAVMARIAAEVVGIERHRTLAELARGRMARLGYHNVRIVEGDGTLGLSGEGLFDSILAAASGSHVPAALLGQLVVGGTLVMPVGEPNGAQVLVRVRRVSEDKFESAELGAVRFVPLIGADGWGGGRNRNPRLAV